MPAALQGVSIIGWNSLLIIFFAKSAVQLGVALGILSSGTHSTLLVPAADAVRLRRHFHRACAAAPPAYRWCRTSFSCTCSSVFGCSICWCRTAGPSSSRRGLRWPSPDRLWNYTTGVELGIGATLSWWPYIGAMIRMAPNGRTVVLPVMLGMCAPGSAAQPDRPRRRAGAEIVRPRRMAAHRRRTHLCDRLARLRHGRELRHDDGRHLCLGHRPAQLRRSAAALVDDAAAHHHHARGARRHFHSGIVLRQVRQFPRADRRRVRSALRNPDRRLLRAAAPADRHPRDLRAEPGRPYVFWRGINPAAIIALAAGCLAYVCAAQSVELPLECAVRLSRPPRCRRRRRRLWYISSPAGW